MEESVRPEPAATRPPRSRAAAPPQGPPHLADPRTLTILTTEHWSLLTARSLVYNEAFSRGSMFLTFLSASLVALGFVAGSGAAGAILPLVAIPVLGLDLFVGIATLARLIDATAEEFRALQGMARLRHAYLELAPDLERYMVAPRHDDVGSVLATYGDPSVAPSTVRNVAHGLTTMPGMVMVIDASLAGAIAAAVGIAAGVDPPAALLVGVVTGIAAMAVFAAISVRVFAGIDRRFDSRFPAPGAGQAPGTGPAQVQPPPQPQAPGRRST